MNFVYKPPPSQEFRLVVDEYVYLGIVFNYNGHFNKAISRLVSLANKAMFAILARGRSLCLDIETQMHLFE